VTKCVRAEAHVNFTPVLFLGIAITFRNVAGFRLIDSKKNFFASKKYFSQFERCSGLLKPIFKLSTLSLYFLMKKKNIIKKLN
jgi:hypothetical protein